MRKQRLCNQLRFQKTRPIGLINLWDMSFVPLGTVTFVASDNARPRTNIWAVSIATTISRRGTANGPRRSNSDKEATRMKKKGWFFFTEPQIKQLKDTNVSLNRMNLTARRALRRVRWSNLTQNQYRQEGLAFGAIADRIVSVLKYRQQILRVAREKEPDVIRLNFFLIGRGCDPSPRKSKDSRNKVPQPGPAHLPGLDSLVESCFETGERVWSHTVPPRTLPVAFFAGLKRLTDALVKQQRHFQDTAPIPPATQIEVLMGDDVCGICHKLH